MTVRLDVLPNWFAQFFFNVSVTTQRWAIKHWLTSLGHQNWGTRKSNFAPYISYGDFFSLNSKPYDSLSGRSTELICLILFNVSVTTHRWAIKHWLTSLGHQNWEIRKSNVALYISYGDFFSLNSKPYDSLSGGSTQSICFIFLNVSVTTHIWAIQHWLTSLSHQHWEIREPDFALYISYEDLFSLNSKPYDSPSGCSTKPICLIFL